MASVDQNGQNCLNLPSDAEIGQRLGRAGVDIVEAFAASVAALVSEQLVQVALGLLFRNPRIDPARGHAREDALRSMLRGFYRLKASGAEVVPFSIAEEEEVGLEAAIMRDGEARDAPNFLAIDVEGRVAAVADGIIEYGIRDQAGAGDGGRGNGHDLFSQEFIQVEKWRSRTLTLRLRRLRSLCANPVWCTLENVSWRRA